jgi:hypothetical protein
MPLTDEQWEELERRGPGNVCRMVFGGQAVGPEPGDLVPLGLAPNPRRRDVEEWLAEKDRAQARLTTKRHRQLLFWARTAGVAAILSVLVGMTVIVLPLLLGAHLLNWLTTAPTLLWTTLKQRL